MEPFTIAALAAAGVFVLRPRFPHAPLETLHVVSPFGPRTLRGVASFHAGVDLRAAVGVEVFAVDAGRVERIQLNTRAGNIVRIRTNGPAGPGVFSCMHLDSVVVNVGDDVQAGDVIARAGATGDVTGPHLHFEWRPDALGRAVDPMPLMPIAARFNV